MFTVIFIGMVWMTVTGWLDEAKAEKIVVIGKEERK